MTDKNDISNIPDNENLEQVTAQIEAEAKAGSDTSGDGDKKKETHTDHPNRNALGQFKSVEDLSEGYKNIQGAFTRTSQENKELKERLAKYEEDIELLKMSSTSQGGYDAGNTDKSAQKAFDESFIEDPEVAVTNKVRQEMRIARIAEVIEEEQAKDFDNFNERYGYVQMLRRDPRYARLGATAAGVKRLFQAADKLRESNIKKNAHKSLATILGVDELDDNAINKLRETLGVKQGENKDTIDNFDPNAYMPDTTSYRSESDTEAGKKKNYDDKISEAAAKGDVDGTIGHTFRKAIEE